MRSDQAYNGIHKLFEIKEYLPRIYLVYEIAIDILLCNEDLVVIVEDCDGLRAG